VVIVEVPFSEGDGGKIRPAVVLSSYDHNLVRLDLVIVKIFGSKASGFWELDINRWSEAGLARPSKVVCDHLRSLPKTAARRVGRLDFRTAMSVRRTVRALLGL
jgi:mRNA interferase MazF